MAEIHSHESYESEDCSFMDREPNLFLNAAVSSSTHWSNCVPALAVNGKRGDTNEHWAAENIPVYLTIDMGTPQYLNAIRLWTRSGSKQVRFSTSALKTEDGHEIPPSAIKPEFVRYVLADGQLFADVIDHEQRLEIEPGTVRPVWVSIDVPPSAAPGTYKGNLKVEAEDVPALSFELNVEVLPIVLPPPSEWSFHLDLWHNPWSVARYHRVEPWSKEALR